MLALIGERVDAEIGPKVHAAVVDLPLRTQHQNQESLQPFRQLEALRSFLAGAGPVALFDMPWMPIYLAVCFLLHAWLGWLTLAGAVVLVLLTLMTEVKSKAPAKAAMEAQSARNAAADAAQRGAEVVRAMGMLPALAARWEKAHEGYLLAQRRANYVVGGLSATAKMFRFVLQSALLGLGALSRHPRPDFGRHHHRRARSSARAHWHRSTRRSPAGGPSSPRARATSASRCCWRSIPIEQKPFALPAPSKSLVVEGLTVAAPGTTKPIVRRLSLKLEAGQALGIIGPSASGKSTLARALVGVWQPQAGKVMLDGATLDQWAPDALGPSIGYLPQDVQLFDGTVAENIARFCRRARPGGRHRGSHGCRLPRARAAHWRTATTPGSVWAGRSSRPGRSNGWGWRAPSTATRSWWCWTSPTPTSMPKARRRSVRRSAGSRRAGQSASSSPIGRAPSPLSI